MLKHVNLRLLAEGDPTPDPTPTPTPTPTPATPPIGKTFSEDYVTTLREEAKTHRLGKKAAEALVRKVLGLKPEDDVDEAKVDQFLASRTAREQSILQTANARLIAAEIRLLEGYDPKLLDRLLDKSKVKIADDGTVTGLKEAAEELAKEFPALLKSSSPPKPSAPGNPALPPPTSGSLAELQTEYEKAKKEGRTVDAIRLNNQIFELMHAKP